MHLIPQDLSMHGVYWLLAEAALVRGEDTLATERFLGLLNAARATDDEISLANSLIGLARLAERSGKPELAISHSLDAAVACLQSGNSLLACVCLEQAAASAVDLGQYETAVLAFAATDAQYRHLTGDSEIEVSIRHRPRYYAALASARTALGDERFSHLLEFGHARPIERSLDELRGLASSPHGSLGNTPRLTDRERDVIRLLAEGRTVKEVAAILGLSRRTVSNYVASILEKLSVPSRTAAAVLAVRDHLI